MFPETLVPTYMFTQRYSPEDQHKLLISTLNKICRNMFQRDNGLKKDNYIRKVYGYSTAFICL
jgi:hypothetical protein